MFLNFSKFLRNNFLWLITFKVPGIPNQKKRDFQIGLDDIHEIEKILEISPKSHNFQFLDISS